MKILLTVLTFLIIQGCDNPQRTRFVASSGSPIGSEDIPTNSFSADGTPVSADTSGPVDATDDDRCMSVSEHQAPSLGSFKVCQPKSNYSLLKIKMTRTHNQQNICFVPVHVTNCGASECPSYKLGYGNCTTVDSNIMKEVEMYKERPDVTNGVMILPEASLSSYMGCMNAKVDFIKANQNCEFSQSCLNLANQYAGEICNRFKIEHGNFYKQVKFFTVQ